MPASEVVAGADISCTPPCSADCCCISLPSCEAGNSCTFSLPPLLAASSSAKRLTPKLTGWSALLRWPKRMMRSCASWARAEIGLDHDHRADQKSAAQYCQREPHGASFLCLFELTLRDSPRGRARTAWNRAMGGQATGGDCCLENADAARGYVPRKERCGCPALGGTFWAR